MIFFTLLLLMPAMYLGGVVCVFYGYCMLAVLIDIYTSVKSEYVSFPIGLSALCSRQNCADVAGLCRLVLHSGEVHLPWVCVAFSIIHTVVV